MFPNGELASYPTVTSDHCQLILNTNPSAGINSDFKFKSFWLDHEGCRATVRDNWRNGEMEAQFGPKLSKKQKTV
jgi:hypothetical protein